MDALVAFSKAVKELREEAGLTRKQVAERSGLSESMIGRLEDGKEDAALDTVLALADGLDIEPHSKLSSVARLYIRADRIREEGSAWRHR